MSTQTSFPTSNAVVTTGWTNPTNAYADDTSYATCAPVGATVSSDYGTFGFDSSIPSGATINSVVVESVYKLNFATGTTDTFGIQPYVGGAAYGTEKTDTTKPIADTVVTSSAYTGLTWTNLNNANFKVRARATATGSVVTWSLDYVKVTVDYTATTTYNQTVTASINVPALVNRQIGKILALVSVLATTLLSAATHLLTMLTTPTLIVSMVKSWSITMLTTQSQVATLIRQIKPIIMATQGTIASMIKQPGKILGTVLFASPALFKRLGQTLTAAITGLATLIYGMAQTRTLSASLTATAILSRNYGKLLLVAASVGGAVQKAITKTLPIVAFSNAFILRGIGKPILATQGASASFQRATAKTIVDQLIFQGTMVRGIAWTFSTPTGITGSLNREIHRTFAVIQGLAVSLFKGLASALTATLTVSSVLAKVQQAIRAMTVSLAVGVAWIKGIQKLLAFSQGSSATLARPMTAPRTLSASLTLLPLAGRIFAVLMTPVVVVAGTVVKRANLFRAATVNMLATYGRAFLVTLRAGFGFILSLVTPRFAHVTAITGLTSTPFLQFARGKTMAVVLAALPVLTRLIKFPLMALQGAVGIMRRGIAFTFSTGTTTIPTIGKRGLFTRALSTVQASVATLSRPATMVRALVAAVALTPGLQRTIGKIITLGSTLSASLAPRAVLTRLLTAGTTASASIAKGIRKAIGASLTLAPASALQALRTLVLTFSVALGVGRTLTVNKGLAQSLGLVPKLTRSFPMRLLAAVSITVSLVALKVLRNVVDQARRVIAPFRRRTWRP